MESYGGISVGDRVVAIRGINVISTGDHGTVMAFTGDMPVSLYVGVSWDKPLAYGHSLGGLCEHGHGWWVPIDRVALEDDDVFTGELCVSSSDELLAFITGG